MISHYGGYTLCSAMSNTNTSHRYGLGIWCGSFLTGLYGLAKWNIPITHSGCMMYSI